MNTRSIIPPYEIDLYFPEQKVGVEICGLYHHSHTMVGDKDYHNRKFLMCEEKGIRLLQFWTSEVRDNLPLVVSMIKSHLGLLEQRVYARKCEVVDIDQQTFLSFLSENHLEPGAVVSTERKALAWEGRLVAVMGFKGSVLQRYCSLRETNVVGGFGKLLAAFDKKHVVTYSDNRYSSGSLYERMGFIKTRENRYRLSVTDTQNVFNRERFMRKRIKDFPGYSEDLTAEEIIIQSGFHYIYGPGTRRWELTR